MKFVIIFAVSFAIVGLAYASLAAFTAVFYKNKLFDELTLYEMNVLGGKANIRQRLFLFLTNLFSSLISPPVYILAIILGGVISLVIR